MLGISMLVQESGSIPAWVGFGTLAEAPSVKSSASVAIIWRELFSKGREDLIGLSSLLEHCDPQDPHRRTAKDVGMAWTLPYACTVDVILLRKICQPSFAAFDTPYGVGPYERRLTCVSERRDSHNNDGKVDSLLVRCWDNVRGLDVAAN
ncbi:hypothetical protein VTN96DRAFT_10421 [Rasamsonia emersonii]